MKKSSIINAFTLLSRKPFLMLLLLPMQAAQPLLAKLMPKAGLMSTPESILPYLLTMLACYGALLLFLLAGSVFLVPPSMELLRDGAAGAETEPGWYSRGLRLHWWKPMALGAISMAIEFVVGIIFYFIIIAIAMVAIIPFGALATSASTDIPSSFGGSTVVMLLAISIPVILLALALAIISCYSSLLLPALADRGFGAAFKAVFSKRGFMKVLKLFGIMLLLGFVSVAAVAAFGAVYVLVQGVPASFEDTMYAFTGYVGSWTYLFVMLLVSLLGLYRYSYSFCLFREIKSEEEAEELKLLSN